MVVELITAEAAEAEFHSTETVEGAELMLERLAADRPECLTPMGYPVSVEIGATRQSVDSSRMMATFCVVTRTKDVNRHGNRVQILADDNGEGLQTKEYKTNPVVLFDHGMSGLALPIGTSRDPSGKLALRLEKSRADADVYFSQTLPDAAVIFGLVDEDMLRMASIGFMATKGMRIKLDSNVKQDEEGVEDLRWPFGWDFVQSSLLEWSITPVGADAGAIRKSIDRGKINGYRMSQGLRLHLQQYAEKPAVWAPGVTLQAKPVEVKTDPAAARLLLAAADLDRIVQSIAEQTIHELSKKIDEKLSQHLDRPAEPATVPAVEPVVQAATVDPAELVKQFRQATQPQVNDTFKVIPALIESEIQKIVQPIADEQTKFTQRLDRALGKV